uniref:Transposase (Putative), gypsy type n=1 Tax=Tanacetum cinerariifolium TaxID=118510 RepID=A0A6L2NL52_TANCI|nr:hypothetical protein [Tanacetum cinerariifolium]
MTSKGISKDIQGRKMIYLLEFTSEYGIPENLNPELPDPEEPIVEFSEEKSPLDFADEDPPPVITERGEEATTKVIPESSLEKEVAAMGPVVNKRRRKGGNEGEGENVPPKVLRKDYTASRPAQSTRRVKSIVPIGLNVGSDFSMPTAQDPPWLQRASSRETATEVPTGHVATTEVQGGTFMESLESGKSTPFLSMDGSPEGGYGFSTEAKAKNLETLLEAEIDMKMAAEAKNLRLAKELESLRAQFADLQVSNNQLSQQVSTLRAQVTGEERIKAAFEEAVPHMLTAITSRRWVIGHGLRLAVMKCAESTELRQVFADVVSAGIAKGMSERLKHGIEHCKANLDLAAIKTYDPKADENIVILKKTLLSRSVSFAPALPNERSLFILRSDGVSVSVPTVSPQGLAILLVNAATHTEISEDEASPRLLRSKSLPPMYNLDWS